MLNALTNAKCRGNGSSGRTTHRKDGIMEGMLAPVGWHMVIQSSIGLIS